METPTLESTGVMGDRVKRIVTESSPHLFLTCSEDGEVRQWDLRQPSSAYPAPRSGRYGYGQDSSVPPPLISYKRYNLDLNTISCSGSQPHYIALGGAHLHAFLHDRRMTGRDRLQEAGKTLSPSHTMTAEDEELMSQATQCVRKFAPKGQQKMKRTENGHVTACKISDARPDEMIVSWSGDHIYSFDLIRPPDVAEEDQGLGPLASGSGVRVKKRKRKQTGSETSLGQDATARASSRPRRRADGEDGEGATLRVRYQNGQSEDISLPPQTSEQQHRNAHPLTARAREAGRIAKSTVSIRSSLFGSQEGGADAVARCTTTLGQAASIMSDIDEAMRDWRYPMEPSPEEVHLQQTLRRNRESTRRFVQGAGTLARLLGGSLRTPSGTSPLLAHFTTVEARSNDLVAPQKEHFGYDFLKAILLWLESGIGRLVEGFTRPAEMLPTVKAAQRLPIPESEASTEAIDDILIPYLLRLASDKAIVNVETNRFEVEANRQLFASEKSAVLAFAAAVKIPFADLSSAIILAEGADRIQAQDRQTATRHWGSKVAKGILLNAAEGVDFLYVDRAFGGHGRVVREVAAQEQAMENISDDDDDKPIQNVEVVDQEGRELDGANADDMAEAMRRSTQVGSAHTEGPAGEGEAEEVHPHASTAEMLDENADQDEDLDDEDENEDEDEDGDDDDDDEDADVSSDPDEEDGVPNTGLPRFMYASAFERRRMREKVESSMPCCGPTRTYRGHCNVRTVKDVNYFGLDDEYVVSGSDDGNFFMWDRKSGELVGLWEGDGEVVNVVQGHPYETMLAVSGIDHTIKIFSPDARARQVARLGTDISSHDPSTFSSISWPRRAGRQSIRRTAEPPPAEGANVTSEAAVPANADQHHTSVDRDDDDFVAPSGLASRRRMHDSYRIVNQNDVERQGGNQDAYITVRSLHALLARYVASTHGWVA